MEGRGAGCWGWSAWGAQHGQGPWGIVAFAGPRLSGKTDGMRSHRLRPAPAARSAIAGFRFPVDVIVLALRWYLRFGLSYRDVEELLTERGVEVDHVTVYRWVQRFTPLLAEAARPCRHGVGDRWQVDETYVKVAGRWRYVYRAVDQFGQVIDVFVSPRRDSGRPAGSSSRPLARPRSDPSRSSPITRGVLSGIGGAAAGGLAPNRAVRQPPGRRRVPRAGVGHLILAEVAAPACPGSP